MTALAWKCQNASCDVRIYVARAYLGAVWNSGDCCGSNGSMLGTLRDGAVVDIGVESTLGYGAVVGICDGITLVDGEVVGIGDAPLGGDLVGVPVGRDVAIIPCRVLMAFICSSPPCKRGCWRWIV